jgi:hypothetical protein
MDMILEHNVDKPLEKGSHLLVAAITSGDVSLQVSVEGSPYVTLDDEFFVTTTTKYLALPKCRVKAIITGVAEVVLGKIEYT